MNIVESIKTEINSELLNTLSAANNETVEKTTLTLDTSLSSILLAFMKRASTETGLNLMHKMIKEDNFSLKKPIENFLSIDKLNKISDEGNALISKIIPDKKSPLITFVASFSGVRNATANRTNGISILLILNKLKEVSLEKSLDFGGLAELFANQKDYLLESAPNNLIEKLSQHIGLGNLISLGSTIISTSTTLSHKNEREQQTLNDQNKYSDDQVNNTKESSLKNWLIPGIFGLLVLAGAGYYYFTQVAVKEGETDVVAIDTVPKIDSSKLLLIDSLKNLKLDSTKSTTNDTLVVEMEEFTLPDGQKITIEKGNTANEIATFLADTSKTNKKTIISNSATFKTGTEIFTEKEETFTNISKLMKAYPASGLKIVVNTYTNNDSTITDKFASRRAFALKKILMNNSIPGIRINAIGNLNKGISNENLKAKEVELTIMKK